jgi:chemotaxis signal transduction protein
LRLGVPLEAVHKVVAAPLLTPLPDAPTRVAGLANLHGAPLVVLDISGTTVPAGRPELEARLMVVETTQRRCGLLCDQVEGTLRLPEEAWGALDDLVPGAGYLAGSRPGEEDLIVLRNPDSWLTEGDEQQLRQALERHRAGGAGEAGA